MITRTLRLFFAILTNSICIAALFFLFAGGVGGMPSFMPEWTQHEDHFRLLIKATWFLALVIGAFRAYQVSLLEERIEKLEKRLTEKT